LATHWKTKYTYLAIFKILKFLFDSYFWRFENLQKHFHFRIFWFLVSLFGEISPVKQTGLQLVVRGERQEHCERQREDAGEPGAHL
jgi:hypothetical protein